MDHKQISLPIEEINESIYGGFGARLGALLLDLVFVTPVFALILYINGFGKNIYYYTLTPNLVFALWYHVFLPQKYGGTPGKLLAGVKIRKMNGDPIGWKEAILRYIISFGLIIFWVGVMIYCIKSADDTTFKSLELLQRTKYLMSFSPLVFKFQSLATNIWAFSEFVVLLTNKKKRSLHDFMAGTVIVKTKYIDRINKVMD